MLLQSKLKYFQKVKKNSQNYQKAWANDERDELL